MATLPDTTAFGERPVPAGSSSVAGYEPPNWRQVGMAGQIVSGAGHDLQEAANTVAATNDRQDVIVAQAAANNLQQQRTSLEFDPNTGLRSVKEGGVVGDQFVKGYTDKFNAVSSAIRDALGNENQRRIFDQHAQMQGLQFKSVLLEHQAQQTEKFNDSTDNDTVSIALRTMAQRPTDELSFQTGLAQIDGTINSSGQRKGLPPQTVAEVKAKLFDAAYSTRILSIANGVPGAVSANPYLAEKMFMQVQDKLGPQAQVTLGHEVQNAVKQVQQRDIALQWVRGQQPTDPTRLYPAIADQKPLEAVVKDMESGGRRYDSNGQLLTSSAGAKGEMQVMPATSMDPGFGVMPAKDSSPEELARVGRDYLGAMTARYDNPAMVLAAYNAGPGQVDKWIAQYGDPRAGQISTQDWANKIPFSETRNYVLNGLQKFGGQAPPGAATTAAELRTRLPDLVKQAQADWLKKYPNDPVGADGVASRVMSYASQDIAAATAQEQAGADFVTRQIVGGAQSVDDVLNAPGGRQAWANLSPQSQLSFQDRLKKGDQKLTPESANLYYGLLGKAGSDPETFVNEDLTKYFGQMPDHLWLQLAGAQKSINSKDVTQQAKDMNWKRALGDVQGMWAPVVAGKSKTEAAKLTEQFQGRLSEALQTAHAQSGKWPTTVETQKIAGSLLAQGATKGSGWLFNMGPDKSTRAFETDPGKFYVPLPSGDELKNLQASYQKVMGKAPTNGELQQWYTKYKLAGGK